MNSIIPVFILVAVACACANPATYSLETDIEDIRRVIPVEKFLELSFDYFVNDAEFTELIKYVKSEDFKQLWTDVLDLDNIKQIIDYCQKHNVDVIEVINMISEILGVPPFTPGRYIGSVYRIGGIAGYFKDVEALMPHDKLSNLIANKYKTSTDFRGLIDLLSLDRFEQFLKTSASGKKFVAFMKGHKVDTQHYLDLLKELFKIIKQH